MFKNGQPLEVLVDDNSNVVEVNRQGMVSQKFDDDGNSLAFVIHQDEYAIEHQIAPMQDE